MSAFKTRRAKLLPVFLVLSILILWQPWSGIEPALRGIKTGPDFAGGYRMVLELQSFRVTLQPTASGENVADDIAAAIETGLGAEAKLVSYDPSTGRMIFDVAGSLTDPMLQKALGDLATVVDISAHVEKGDLEKSISSLRSRVDPYELLEVRLRSFGDSSVIFESSEIDPNRARDLLGAQGRLEMFIDNQLVLSNSEVSGLMAPVAAEGVAYVPVSLTTSGTALLKQACSGKASHPIVIYLDRPSDAIIVFDNSLLKGAARLFYDENAREFYVTRETGLAVSTYYISVLAVPVSGEGISQEVKAHLLELISEKARVVLLGSSADYPSELIQWLSTYYRITTVPRREGESVDDWVLRACGVQSAPLITQTMAAGGVTGELTIPILGKTQAQALVKAQNFQRAVAHRLDFPIIFTQEVSLPPAFGSNIKESLLIAAGVALLLALALLYFAFSRVRVALVIIAFMFVDAVLTLAGISVLSLPLGLSTVSGLLFVVLSGLSQHVIITNELLKGVQTQEKVSIGWRSSRALSISYLASLTVILISISIALLGFGSIRVFAITTAAGMIIAVLLTRPVFARMMESVLSWTPQRTPPESAKPEQKQQ